MVKNFYILSSAVFLLFCSAHDATAIQLTIGTKIDKPVKNYKQIKRRNIISQSLDYSCGPASLATLLTYYFGDIVREKEIIKYLL